MDASDPERTKQESTSPPSKPWPEQLYDSEWLLAMAAIVFFVLSYVVWGLVDLLTIPAG